jgi:hypothetical protein
MKKAYLLFVSVAIVINALIYFYPADLFQVETTPGIFNDATLKQLLTSEGGFSFSGLTLKGWFLLFVFSLGIPAIIGWRSTLQKYGRKTGEEEKSIYDKLK